MKVHCHTNIDEGKRHEWPTEMSCRPLVGDCVESRGGMILRICRVTHQMSGVLDVELTDLRWKEGE